jgi:ABC-type transport system substrate-binding protein
MAGVRSLAINARRLVLATFVAAAFAALGPADAPRAAEPKKGGSVSISMESDLPTLDPLGFASFNDRNAGLLLYDTLLDIDAKGNVVPNIAERIDASEDVMTFKLTLRSGVKFTDGTSYDAAAVVKNFQRIMDPKNRCRCVSDLATINTVEATGPLEVVIKMKSPSAHFPATLADVAGMVASPTAIEKYGADFGNHGIGAGPFKLKEWRRGAQVIFERNADYWRKAPNLDEVVLRPMPDEQTRYASLKAGNLDIVTNAAARDRVDATQEKRFQILNPGSLATSFIQVNLGSADVSDIRIRQALALALDRVALNRALNRGLYKIANTPFGTGLFPHEAVDGYPGYDPAKAKKLVEEYGKPVKIKLSINASPVNALAGQALQQMWKKIGIETEIIPLEQVQLVRTAASRDYQVMLYRWAGGADPDKNVHQFFHSKGTVNRVNFNNAEMDKLLDQGRATTNQAERLKVYRQINNLLAKELPYLFLWYFDNVAIANPAVKGITPIPDGLLRMHSAWKDK